MISEPVSWYAKSPRTPTVTNTMNNFENHEPLLHEPHSPHATQAEITASSTRRKGLNPCSIVTRRAPEMYAISDLALKRKAFSSSTLQYTFHTSLPPTIVQITFASLILSAEILNRSSDTITRSAYFPGVIDPRFCSTKLAYAPLIVYA